MDTNNYYQDRRVNQFDIEPFPSGKWQVKTFRKEGEHEVLFQLRHKKNIAYAKRLKSIKPTIEHENILINRRFLEK